MTQRFQNTELFLPSQAFDGATTHFKVGYRGLLNQGGTPDELASRELKFLYARTHHLIRNNAFIKAALRQFSRSRSFAGLESCGIKWFKASGKPDKALQKLWDNFIERCNLDGKGGLWQTIEEWNYAQFYYEESLSRLIIQKRKGRDVPLSLQNIPSEFLDPEFTGYFDYPKSGNYTNTVSKVRNGIEFNNSAPTAYYFYRSNFGGDYENIWDKQVTENTTLSSLSDWYVKVPAEQVLHSVDRLYPGQWRGIPKLAPSMLLAFQKEDLQSAILTQQLNAQGLSLVVTQTKQPASIMTPAMGAMQPVVDSKSGDTEIVITAEPGQSATIPYGYEAKAFETKDIGSNLQVLLKTIGYETASSLDTHYTLVTGDHDGMTFASLQHEMIQEGIRRERFIHLRTIGEMLNPLTTKFRMLAAALIDGRFEGSYCTFQLPKYQTVNDLKDKQSAVLALQNGLALYENELAKAGISKDQMLHDLEFQLTVAQERAKIEALKSGVNPNEAKAPEANSNSKGA